MGSEPAVIDQNRDLWLLGKFYENIALIHRWGKKDKLDVIKIIVENKTANRTMPL